MGERDFQPASCLLCQSAQHDSIFRYAEPDPYEKEVGVVGEGYSREWAKCKSCGMFYSRYSRDVEAISKIYVDSYRSEHSPWRNASVEEVFEKIVNLPPEESETKFRVDWIKSKLQSVWKNGLVRQQDSPCRLLDIGGGNGVFAYEFQRDDKDWSSHIIDPSGRSEFIKEKLGIHFVQDYYSPGKFGFSFDLVSLVFVLEHMTDPTSLLQSVREDMKETAFLYVEVPDAICFKHKPKEDDIFNSCHLWMFSPNTLTLLLGKCGFDVFSLERVKTKRDHYALMVLAGKK